MCAITLTLLQTCKHELPTIEFCREATKCLNKSKKKCQRGVEAALPPLCTDSLGWTFFKSIDAPVVCEGCRMWLHLNGKKTYSMLADEHSAAKQEGTVLENDAEERKETGSEEKKDDEEDENEAPMTEIGVNEMQKLQSKLSRTFGVTGQRQKRRL